MRCVPAVPVCARARLPRLPALPSPPNPPYPPKKTHRHGSGLRRDERGRREGEGAEEDRREDVHEEDEHDVEEEAPGLLGHPAEEVGDCAEDDGLGGGEGQVGEDVGEREGKGRVDAVGDVPVRDVLVLDGAGHLADVCEGDVHEGVEEEAVLGDAVVDVAAPVEPREDHRHEGGGEDAEAKEEGVAAHELELALGDGADVVERRVDVELPVLLLGEVRVEDERRGVGRQGRGARIEVARGGPGVSHGLRLEGRGRGGGDEGLTAGAGPDAGEVALVGAVGEGEDLGEPVGRVHRALLDGGHRGAGLLLLPGRRRLLRVRDGRGRVEAEAAEVAEEGGAGAVVDDVALAHEDDVVEEVVDLGRGLEEGDDDAEALALRAALEAVDDGVGDGGVEARADLVAEEGAGAGHDALADRHALALATGDAADEVVADEGVWEGGWGGGVGGVGWGGGGGAGECEGGGTEARPEAEKHTHTRAQLWPTSIRFASALPMGDGGAKTTTHSRSS